MRILKVADAPIRELPNHAGNINRVLVNNTTGGKTMDVSYGCFAPGGFAKAHTHEFEQVFFVLKGELTATVKENKAVAGPATVIHILAGEEHFIKNEGKDPVEFLAINGSAEYRLR